LVLALMLCACGGDGGGGGSTVGPDDDGANTETPPVDDGDSGEPGSDDTDPLSMTAPGFTGDPANGNLSDAAVMAQAFAPHTEVATRFDGDYFYVESDGLRNTR
jgi:hypothetical protein